MTSITLDTLKTQHPFDYLTDTEFEKITDSVETESYPAGTHILNQDGEASKHLQIISQGAVRLVRDGNLIRALEEGECFGHPSMISQDSPSVDVIAEEDTRVFRIPDTVFNRLVTDNTRFANFFLKSLGSRLRSLATEDGTPMSGELTTPVGSLIVRPPVLVSPAATVADAAKIMRKAWVNVALVMDTPPGIITDHDFQVKVLAEDLGPETPVQQVMSRPLKTIPLETPVYGALLFMLEENIHHVPVIQEGEIKGIINATDLLRHQSKSPLYLMRQLDNLDVEPSQMLAKYAVEIAGMVENLYRGGLDINSIGRVIASINDALIRRLLRLAEQELGPPPTPYAWIVFGSEGRMEQALLTDQDNALIYKDDTPKAKKYFSALAENVVNHLIQAGFPPCPGGYMATNWCKPLAEWIRLFDGWIRTPDPQALLETAIFFDFRAVYGSLSVEPLHRLVNSAGDEGVFLAHMARAAMEFKPPIGFFRRIRAENGEVNLKSGGVAPIVALARVYALEGHIHARTTFERLEAAVEAGTLSQEGAENLIETYRFLLKLRLREQLDAVKSGNAPNNRIHLQSLSAVENRHLKDAFSAIREMQDAASQRFRTDMLG